MKLNAVWVGAKLSYIEQLCLSSAVNVGHEVDLYAYEPIADVPVGVHLKDAASVMSRDRMVRYAHTDSFALGSNLFRLMLQKKGLGCYIDCDMLLLKPVPDEDYIFGWERIDSINNAILKLPSKSPVIDDIFSLIGTRPIVPPWWKYSHRLRQWRRWIGGKDMNVAQLPWGTTGPRALTYFAAKHGLEDKAKSIAAFYPNPFEAAEKIFDPSVDISSCFTNATLAVHLWHNKIKMFRNAMPLPGSFIAQHCERLGVRDARWPIPAAA